MPGQLKQPFGPVLGVHSVLEPPEPESPGEASEPPPDEPPEEPPSSEPPEPAAPAELSGPSDAPLPPLPPVARPPVEFDFPPVPPPSSCAPPVPMIVRNWVINVDGVAADQSPPRFAGYPEPGARDVYPDAVVKVSFSEPVTGVDASSFTLTDADGAAVPAAVDQIGPGTFGLFPHRILLKPGATYRARLAAGVADAAGNRTGEERFWTFTVAADAEHAAGNTAIPRAFAITPQPIAVTQPPKRIHTVAKGKRHGHRHRHH